MTWADRKRPLESLSDPARPVNKRILINLVGAPGCGKSTLAAAFCRANPGWSFFPIDQYMLSGLKYEQAWEALRTHARFGLQAIVESSGLSRQLRPLLTVSNHCTIIVTSDTAKERRDARPKEPVPEQQQWGTQDDLAKACERLPKIYPEALVCSADGPWKAVLARFTKVMAQAAERARAGSEGKPQLIRKKAKYRPRKRPPHKRRAWKAVERALKKGELAKGPCEVCGGVKVQAHHDDYSRPLDVRWLCEDCHVQHHARIRRAEARRASGRQ